MKTKFIHKRFQTTIPGLEQQEISGKGGVTIAYVPNEDTNEVLYAIARCHPRDNFNKQQGRIKAEGKMKSLKHLIFFKGNEKDFKEMIYNTPTLDVGKITNP